MTMTRVLLIDDDELTRFALAQAMELADLTVTTAEDGWVVSDADVMDGIDVVITDIVMPQRDGIEVITQIKKSRPGVPVIAISGGGRIDGGHYTRTASFLGADAVFEKPLHEDALIAKVKELAA